MTALLICGHRVRTVYADQVKNGSTPCPDCDGFRAVSPTDTPEVEQFRLALTRQLGAGRAVSWRRSVLDAWLEGGWDSVQTWANRSADAALRREPSRAPLFLGLALWAHLDGDPNGIKRLLSEIAGEGGRDSARRRHTGVESALSPAALPLAARIAAVVPEDQQPVTLPEWRSLHAPGETLEDFLSGLEDQR
jgi:hypothetical protein